MKPPCDEAVVRSGRVEVPCAQRAQPWILAATILASSMAFIDSTVVNVALPALQNSFHANVVDVQWVVESYGLFLAALILVGGALGDSYGRRSVFVVGVAIFAVASGACGLSSSIHQLIIVRSIQGIGAALLVPGSLAIISTSFDEKSRGRAIGTWSGFTAITSAFGPVLGGWLIEHASWRWAFFINLPLSAAVIVISLWHIPESRNASAGHIDWLGALVVTLGLGGLVAGFVESSILGWTHPLVFGSLIVGCICLIAFPYVEMRVASPMVPLTLFSSRSFSGTNLVTLLLYSAIGIFFFLFPLNLIQVRRYSTTAAGAALLPFILLMFFLSRWAGGLVARYGPRLPLIVGPVVIALGFVMLALPAVGGSYWITFFPAIMVTGFGMTITVAPLTTVVMSSVGPDRVGAASGINNAIARLAGVLAVAVFGIVMVKAFSHRLDQLVANFSLSPAVLHDIHANEIRLAGLQVPAGVDAAARAAISASVDNSFVFGFRIVLLMCVALAVASAGIAWLMIPRKQDS
jgi:EmrB/QacA subfamily drug resistance transporter